ncbi:MAG: hypothetical protein ACOC9P_02705, partial [bacterium]
DTGWEPRMQWSARALTSGWIIEAAIPFEALGSTPEKGEVWGVNIGRNDERAGHITLAPLTRGFHDPEGFCRLRFGAERKQQVITLDDGNRRAFDEFDKLITRLNKQIDALPGKTPGRHRLDDRIESARDTATAVKHEMEDHPVFAATYGEWACGFLLDELRDDVRWRLRTVELFVFDQVEALE